MEIGRELIDTGSDTAVTKVARQLVQDNIGEVHLRRSSDLSSVFDDIVLKGERSREQTNI